MSEAVSVSAGTGAAGWDAVRGQSAAVGLMRAALRSDEVAHAWLLVGPSGVGQGELAQAMAAALNCPVSDQPDVGCGVCSICVRIGKGTFPAVREFEPEGAFHVVDAVRSDWIPTAMRSLAEGRRKVLRVVAADRMNEGAQNAFLKVLEEPPPSVVWLLDAADEGLLLDTVVSRCRRVEVVPWTPDALGGLADDLGIAAASRDALVRASQGSPDRLRDLADPDLAEARARHLGLVGQLSDRGPGAVVSIVKELSGWAKGRMKVRAARNEDELAVLAEAYGVEADNPRSRGAWPPGVKQRLQKRFARIERQEQRRALDMLLDDLGSYLRDLLAVGAGADETTLVNIDHLESLRRDAARMPVTGAIEGLAAITDCREALERNGQPELQLERLLLRVSLPLYQVA